MSKGVLCMMAMAMAACSAAPQPQAQPPGAVTLPTALPTVASVTTADEARLVPIETIEDSRIRKRAKWFDPSATHVVEVAPGVYAERGHTESLDPSLYSSVFGLCADVTLYQEAHEVAGTCW